MLLHASIVADDPQTTAQAIARLWAGEAFPMPGPGEGTWTVLTQQSPGTAVEVLQRGSEFHSVEGEHVQTKVGQPVRASGVHVLLETTLEESEIEQAATDLGLPAWKVRHGYFSVFEVWLDGCFLLELMTPQMAAEYRTVVTLENARLLAQLRAAAA